MIDINLRAHIGRDAGLIDLTAEQTVTDVMEKRQQLDNAGQEDEALVVMLGTIHDRPGDQLHHLFTIERTAKNESVAVSYEYEHDFVQQQFCKVTGQELDPAIQQSLRAADMRNDLSVKAFLADGGAEVASYSHRLLLNFLLRQQIRTKFTDAAINRTYLDYEDPSTKASMQHCLRSAMPGQMPRSRKGMYVRNHHMAVMNDAFVKACKPRILFVLCGNGHVVGNRAARFPGTESLASIQQEFGNVVLAKPIISKAFKEEDLPMDNIDTKVIRRLPEVKADYQCAENTEDSPNLCTRTKELIYANRVLEISGYDEYAMSVAEDMASQRKYAEETNMVFEQCRLASSQHSAPALAHL